MDDMTATNDTPELPPVDPAGPLVCFDLSAVTFRWVGDGDRLAVAVVASTGEPVGYAPAAAAATASPDQRAALERAAVAQALDAGLGTWCRRAAGLRRVAWLNPVTGMLAVGRPSVAITAPVGLTDNAPATCARRDDGWWTVETDSGVGVEPPPAVDAWLTDVARYR